MSLVGPGEKTAASGEGFSSITSVIPRTRRVSPAGSRQRMAIGTRAASSARYGASIAMIALPFKLMLFVLADGWNLLLGSLAASFST